MCAAPLGAQGVCDGRPIRAIRIDVRTIFSADDTLIPRPLRALGNDLHWQTREQTVRRDLLFAVGENCDPRRLSETERLLRARPYIRSALVVPIATADGGVSILVLTRDEFSLELRLRIRGGGDFPIRRVVLTEDNVLGRGLHAQVYYNNFGRRAAFYMDGLDHHFLGDRIEAELMGGKSEVGPVGEVTVRRAFESEFDRLAWRGSGRYRKEPFPLVSTTLGTVLQPLVQIGADAGAAVRLGRPGALSIVGAVLSGERLLVESQPLAPSADLDSAAAAQLAGRFEERRLVRVHLLLGARRLSFHPHRGLDAVRGIEDAPQGAQAGLVLGKSLFDGAGLQHDWFAAAEYASGTELRGRALAFFRAKVEGRYRTEVGRWEGVIANGELLVYNLSSKGTTVLGAEAAGGWQTQTPFQLLLAGPNGIRGFGGLAIPVGRRIVMHVEHRYFVGTVFGAADIGTAAFAEGGRGWAGDAPFGENTGLLVSIGVGARVAVPSDSRRTWRLDLTMPLNRGLGPELRVTIRQQFGFTNGEPTDVVRSRERISSVTVFDFPRF